MPANVSSQLAAIVALVEIAASLLSFGQIDFPRQAVFSDDQRSRRRLAPQQAVGDLQAFCVAKPFFGPQDDASRFGQFVQQFDQQLLPSGQRQAGELHAQPAVVAIDGQSRQPVRFAVDQPIRGDVSGVTE
jgi:hypothetical protein